MIKAVLVAEKEGPWMAAGSAATRTRRGSLRTRIAALALSALGLVVTGRLLTGVVLARLPAAGGDGPKPVLALAGHSRLGNGIRSGFTSDAAEAVHALVTAFEARRVDLFAGLVDLDYELDYHRLLHDLEGQFSRTDDIDLAVDLVSVEPLPEGFAAEVQWQKSFRVLRTGHRVHLEGLSRLIFAGDDPPRLLAIRGEMPF